MEVRYQQEREELIRGRKLKMRARGRKATELTSSNRITPAYFCPPSSRVLRRRRAPSNVSTVSFPRLRPELVSLMASARRKGQRNEGSSAPLLPSPRFIPSPDRFAPAVLVKLTDDYPDHMEVSFDELVGERKISSRREALPSSL